MSRPGTDPEFGGTERFVIERKLGEGGIGAVYSAYDRALCTPVALKVLHAKGARSLQRFKREFRQVAEVVHPNLVRLGELFCEDGQWFFTMELLEGASLLSYVRGVRGEPSQRGEQATGDARLRTAFAQIARGVLALHQAQLVHRDLKPSNVLVTSRDRVVLVDVGLVLPLLAHREGEPGPGADDLEPATFVAQDSAYQAPERQCGDETGPEADWYSVGAMLYEALTGHSPSCASPVPFAPGLADGAKRVTGASSQGTLDPALLPGDLGALCRDLLEPEPGRRPKGHDVLSRLGASSSGLGDALGELGRSIPATELVGRKRELAFLRDALFASRTRQVTVLIEGESGLGKTALVTHFLHSFARSRPDAVALEGRCYERESVPYKAWDGVVDALTRRLSRMDPVETALIMSTDAVVLARLFPALRRLSVFEKLPEIDLPDPQTLRARAFTVFRELLERLVSHGPLVISLDDLQWSDADSLLLLRELVKPPDPPPFLLVATVRPGAQDLLAELPGEVRHLALEALLLGDAEELARELLGARKEHAATLAAESAGHPLFLHALSRHLASAEDADVSNVHLDDVLYARVSGLEGPERRLLELLAVAAAPVSVETASAALAIPAGELLRLVPVLRTAQLVRTSLRQRMEVYHDRIREVLCARLAPERLRECHGELARGLEAAGADEAEPEALLFHLEAIGQMTRAALHAVRAAERASQALAFDQAAVFYRTALRLGGLETARARAVQRALGDALASLGRGPEAADCYVAAAEGEEGLPGLELRRRAAGQLLVSGHVDRGHAMLVDVLLALGARVPVTPRRVLFSLLLGNLRVALRGLRFRERREGELSPEDLLRMDAYWTAAEGLALVDIMRSADFQIRDLLLSLRSGEPTRIARAIAGQAMMHGVSGRRRRAEALLSQARALAERAGQPMELAFVEYSASVLHIAAGRFRQAVEAVDRAIVLYRERCAGVAFETDIAKTSVTGALAMLGRLAELRRRVRLYLEDAEARGDLLLSTFLRTGEGGMAWLVEGDVEEAKRNARQAAANYSPAAAFLHLYYDVQAVARIRVYADEGRAAWQLFEERWPAFERSLLSRVTLFRTILLNTRAISALAVAAGLAPANPERGQLLREVEAAARYAERRGVPCRGGEACLLRAGVAAAREDARAPLLYDEAARRFDACEMTLHAEVARRRQGELLGGDEGRLLVEGADAWMRSETVKDPERFAAVIAPSFAR
jgi:hypothetical protein